MSPLTLVSWNIQVGSDSPILGNNWRARKSALVEVLLSEDPDIMCLQEPLIHQLQFIESQFPDHKAVGVGRDDGKQKGEYCAILYRVTRLEPQDSGTFWLSDTPDQFGQTWDLIYKRICTWCKFSDKQTGKVFFVFNTHFPLNPFAQANAASLVLKRIESICERGNVLLTGDFNSTPQSIGWKLFQDAGLRNSESILSGGRPASATYQFMGRAAACIDAVFVSKSIEPEKHRLLCKSVGGVWPSDHFGICVQFCLVE